MDNDKLQIYPTRKRITLNDKATKLIFNLTPDNYSKILQGKNQKFLEKKKKNTKIISAFTLTNKEGYTQILPLDEYDRAVFDVCISEWLEGNEYLTLSMIQRGLSGKITENAEIHTDQRAAILTSIDKLRHTDFDADLLDAFKKLDYDGAEKIKKASVLSTETLQKNVGGQIVDIFHILADSPLLKIAQAKGQLLTYDADLLDVPKQNNTRLVVMLKNYTLRRVLEIKQHSKQFKPILTLDDIFTKCRITDASRKAKLDARATIDKFFAHLQSKGVINSYEWTKKGNKFYSIKFTF